ncbi:phage/plasmid primase, P4 family [Mobiluncus curtisii]|uniref:phage/plasmid primase, P4 family n=1 Tax=Mobiluncus curtisii TaxID=2051 RepID=UPI0014703376|nr:phage/plasmid primase, P4 family [Mobiluncus curtisii]NMW89515.1 DNA primase [Mobiluncus curtisii]
MTEFHLNLATVSGAQRNLHYPRHTAIVSAADLKQAVAFDHVAATYDGDMRGSDRFIASDCVVMDVDNDHSENPAEWVTPETLALIFPDVTFATATSRNHQKDKSEKSARPRFHAYLPIATVTDGDEYASIKRKLASFTGIFDRNALDSARFIYGTTSPEVTWTDGELTIVDFLDGDKFAALVMHDGEIREGSRNATMSRFAGRVIVRFGNSDEARELFEQKATQCVPPLPPSELDAIWHSALKFGAKVVATPGYIPPERYAEIQGLRPTDFTDVGQANVLADEYAQKLAFSEATDWLVYNGSFWEETRPGSRAIAQELTTRQLEQAAQLLEKAREACDSTGVTQLLSAMSLTKAKNLFTNVQWTAYEQLTGAQTYEKYVLKRRDSKAITASLKEAAPMLQVTQADLDADPFALNTPGGTIDLTTGQMYEHDYGDFITKQTTTDPATRGMDTWLAALEVFFQGDQELIDYVQRIVGLTAIGKVYVEALIIAYGDGRNGKSTFWNTIARVLGTYAGNISADALTVGVKRNVKPELAEAKGKRLLIAAETEEGMRLSTSIAKQMASTDLLYAEKKYKAPFAFAPSHTLVLYTNHLPRVGAMDVGIWRRLIVIPFEAKIEGSSDIKNYAEHLYQNAAGAVLQWIVDGARKVIDDDFVLKPPPKVRRALEAYRFENDWMTHFLDDNCEIDPSFTQPSGELYSVYRAYALSVGEYARSTSDFYSALEQLGFRRRRTKSARYVDGLRLKSEFNL